MTLTSLLVFAPCCSTMRAGVSERAVNRLWSFPWARAGANPARMTSATTSALASQRPLRTGANIQFLLQTGYGDSERNLHNVCGEPTFRLSIHVGVAPHGFAKESRSKLPADD